MVSKLGQHVNRWAPTYIAVGVTIVAVLTLVNGKEQNDDSTRLAIQTQVLAEQVAISQYNLCLESTERTKASNRHTEILSELLKTAVRVRLAEGSAPSLEAAGRYKHLLNQLSPTQLPKCTHLPGRRFSNGGT